METQDQQWAFQRTSFGENVNDRRGFPSADANGSGADANVDVKKTKRLMCCWQKLARDMRWVVNTTS